MAHKDQLVVIADILWQLLGILCGFAELSLQSQGALHWDRVMALRHSAARLVQQAFPDQQLTSRPIIAASGRIDLLS